MTVPFTSMILFLVSPHFPVSLPPPPFLSFNISFNDSQNSFLSFYIDIFDERRRCGKGFKSCARGSPKVSLEHQLCKSWGDIINLNCKSSTGFCARIKLMNNKCPTFAKLFPVARHWSGQSDS